MVPCLKSIANNSKGLKATAYSSGLVPGAGLLLATKRGRDV